MTIRLCMLATAFISSFAACTSDEQEAAAHAGASNTSGRGGGAGASGAEDSTGGTPEGGAASAPPDHSGEPGYAEVTEACILNCAWAEGLDDYALSCRVGERFRHGRSLDEDGAAGAGSSQAPRSTDQACIAGCIDSSFKSWECWQQAAGLYACQANAVWVCDGMGGIDTRECDVWLNPANACPDP